MKERRLATLFVHLRTMAAYYSEHDKFVEDNRNRLREEWRRGGFSDTEIERTMESQRILQEDMWFWPPWRFNDIVGFVEILYDGGMRLLGQPYFPKKRISRQLSRKAYYYQSDKYEMPLSSLEPSYVWDAFWRLLKEIDSDLKKRKLHLEVDEDLLASTDIVRLISKSRS